MPRAPHHSFLTTQGQDKLRMFTLIDDCTRECHILHTDHSVTVGNVLMVWKEMIERQGAPEPGVDLRAKGECRFNRAGRFKDPK